jgi:hypothetical protein
MSRSNVWLAAIIVGALLFCFGCLFGSWYERTDAVQVERDQLRKAFEQGQELGTVRDNVVTEYVDRVQVIKERGATIIKEVPVYVSAQADAACTVNAGFVRVHDASARSLPAPEPSGAADEAPSGIALSTVAATTAANYTDCNANAEQLSKLQTIVREYQEYRQ